MKPTVHAAVLLVFLWTPGDKVWAADSSWRDPDPFRLEGVTEGRSFTYDTEGFQQRHAYRSLSPARPGQDSLYGTGGSVTSDELYLDVNLRKTLRSDDDRFAVTARMQRSEDMDGRFSRQLVGVAIQPLEHWEAAFLADLNGDKGLMDFQYELHWRPDRTRLLRIAAIQTDPLYNRKADSINQYEERPLSWFAGYHDTSGKGRREVSLNISPDVTYEDRFNGYNVTASRWRLYAALEDSVARNWRGRMQVMVEQAERSYVPASGRKVPGDDFSRRFHHVTASLGRTDIAWRPRFGLRHLRFSEHGYSGAALNRNGWQNRREAAAFMSLHVDGGDRHWWEPVLEVARLDREEQFGGGAYERRRTAVRLGVPWRYEVDAQRGAVLTVNLTFRLHAGAFGGGNIQLHWPL